MQDKTFPFIDNLGPSVILGPECFGAITPKGVVWTICYRGVWYTSLTSPGADLPDALLPLDEGLFPADHAADRQSEAIFEMWEEGAVQDVTRALVDLTPMPEWFRLAAWGRDMRSLATEIVRAVLRQKRRD